MRDRPHGYVIVRPGLAAGRGAHTALACRIGDIARALGFTARVEQSRVALSRSRHLYLTDRLGREWYVRISDHRRPERARIPNIDLVSPDAVQGMDDVIHLLNLAAEGRISHVDTADSAISVPNKLRRRLNRRNTVAGALTKGFVR